MRFLRCKLSYRYHLRHFILKLLQGANALFDFSIHGADGKFSVISDGERGYISVYSSLDFETDKNMTFLVRSRHPYLGRSIGCEVPMRINRIDALDVSVSSRGLVNDNFLLIQCC